jgi:thioredoxin 1
MNADEIRVGDDNFKAEVLDSALPVLVDFWASWCGPCTTVAPRVAEVAKAYRGKLKVCTVDIDEAPDSASRHEVMSIPTLALFSRGKEVDRIVGAVPRSAIETMVTRHL